MYKNCIPCYPKICSDITWTKKKNKKTFDIDQRKTKKLKKKKNSATNESTKQGFLIKSHSETICKYLTVLNCH